MFNGFVEFVRDLYRTKEFIPLHRPYFIGNEKKYLLDTIDSTFVSSVGAYVDQFEQQVAKFTGSKFAVATVNGTAAQHIALLLTNVEPNDEVITQSLSFVATCNAIKYCQGVPVFVDVDQETLGLSPNSLEIFLEEYAEIRDDGFCWNKSSGRRIMACVPMHTFGLPLKVIEVKAICDRYNIALVEDAAESLGSLYHEQHTGTIGKFSTLSFNGNKIITTGGGGMILTDDQNLADRAKHLTTTAKLIHPWHYDHDETGYNYRLPNLNAALGVAQMESLPEVIKNKRNTALQYQNWGDTHEMEFIRETHGARSNYWLNAVLVGNMDERDVFLNYTNTQKVMTRPVWRPLHLLPMNQNSQTDDLTNTLWAADCIVNVPSSVVCHE